MKLLIEVSKLEELKSTDAVLCECSLCKKEFTALKKYVVRELKYKRGEVSFCSKSCATISNNTKRVLLESTKNRIKNSLIKKKAVYYVYECEKCAVEFTSKRIRKERKKTCENCRGQKTIQSIDSLNSLYEVSSRTLQKILKRANICCAICGWDKTTLDIHHIYGRKIVDANEHKNLICLCPNCHRLAHEKKIEAAELIKNSLANKFIDWKKYYNTEKGKVCYE